MVGRQNADIADTPYLRDVAMATTFWLSMGYNFGCMIASDMLFDSRGWVFGDKLFDEDIAEIECVRVVAIWNHFWLSIMGCIECGLECGPMSNVMAALPNICGALCSTPQSFADAHY